MASARRPITREIVDGSPIYRLRGRRITRVREIERLNALAIPPAWVDVEIARSPSAKVLARGLDAAGRVQAIYHPAFRRKQDRAKFTRLIRFADQLPALRAQVDRDLRKRSLSRERVVACILRIIDEEYFRVGNAAYARRHRSYGATTLRTSHATATSTSVTFDFVGKGGKRHTRTIRDRRVATLIARLEELPGAELFRFLDQEEPGGEPIVRNVDSRHVNAYVKRVMGEEFTAKDFRTWGGTMLATSRLLEVDPVEFKTPTSTARAVRGVVAAVAERLGNTPAVTRSSYIDPRVLAAAEDPALLARLRRSRARLRDRRHWSADEQCTVRLLRGT